MKRILVAALLAAASGLGATWQPESQEVPVLELSVNLGNGQPVAVDPEGRVFVLFQNIVNDSTYQVGCLVRGAQGDWMSAEVLSPDRNSRNPSVAAGRDGRVHVLWEDIVDGSGEIIHRVREADGSWSEPVAIAPAPGVSREPVVAVDAYNRVHAVWIDARSGLPKILHAVLPPGGEWGEPTVLSPDADNPDQPCVDADAVGAVHVVWRDRVGSVRTGVSYDLFYLRVDGTDLPGAPVPLVTHVSIAQWPSIAATGDGVLHLVWVDNRDALQGSYFEVYYKRFLPGIGWGHEKRFTRDYVDHARPMVAVGAGSTVNVAWEDYRDGNSEIGFRQITPELGWDPAPTRISMDISSSQAPALAALPGGGLLALWTDARGFGDFRLLTRSGTILPPR